ncbi:unnamed protein product [Candida verbasci]|uniref:HECT-type E3 ubiquitin transferase n=1 Tax=Candida verbasci TaxID=1227364 RepID=A0A9W4TXB8_9ASCO|nr:unnamed protein product [Candida verbasci]
MSSAEINVSSKNNNNQHQQNQSSWKFPNFFKLSSSAPVSSTNHKTINEKDAHYDHISMSTHSSTSTTKSQNVGKCYCCGTVLTFPTKSKKFRCSICHTTNILETSRKEAARVNIPLISVQYVESLIERCSKLRSKDSSKSVHEAFEPLSTYVYKAFNSFEVLNNSFKLKNHCQQSKYTKSYINFKAIHDVFNKLLKLPTKQPLYNALKGSSDQLKRIHIYNEDINVRDYIFLIILLEIPILSKSLVPNELKVRHMSDIPEIKMLCYDILKRILGILSCIDQTKIRNYIIQWFSKYDLSLFIDKINLINLYVTFQLKKYFYLANNPHVKLVSTPPESNQNSNDIEYFQSLNLKTHIESNADLSAPLVLNFPAGQVSSNPFAIGKGKKMSNKETKVKVHQYGNDWHIKSALIVLTLFYKANKLRAQPLPVSNFYNSLVDYVNIRLDFDSWQSNKKSKNKVLNNDHPELKAVIGYIHGTTVNKSLYDDALYYLCQYPIIISLGSKISVLEYDARRQMERKAEEAFINSLDKRTVIDVYFRIRIRREYIVQDSLSCIKLNSDNLKKSLKIQFVNEPGVDAGGLRKEWFLLLTREIFNPQTGMFYNVEDSNLLWFHIIPIENSDMYYLFGAILGLAIYNSTILDLQFPLALYKILLGRSLDFENYEQLFPVSFKNLMSLNNLSDDELRNLDIAFEVTYTDICGKYYTQDLMPNGKNIKVSKDNLHEYLEKYINFFMKDGIKTQIEAFKSGFNAVIGGNALSLFAPNEIELLLCGSSDHKIDVDILKSVTKYAGWNSNEEAINSQLIIWFWEFMNEISNDFRKKVLIFITGSDRVPATGIQNLSFRISLLNHGYDSDRLPIAHTCFNELAIYNYSSKLKFQDKMTRAVNESSGFGIK